MKLVCVAFSMFLWRLAGAQSPDDWLPIHAEWVDLGVGKCHSSAVRASGGFVYNITVTPTQGPLDCLLIANMLYFKGQCLERYDSWDKYKLPTGRGITSDDELCDSFEGLAAFSADGELQHQGKMCSNADEDYYYHALKSSCSGKIEVYYQIDIRDFTEEERLLCQPLKSYAHSFTVTMIVELAVALVIVVVVIVGGIVACVYSPGCPGYRPKHKKDSEPLLDEDQSSNPDTEAQSENA